MPSSNPFEQFVAGYGPEEGDPIARHVLEEIARGTCPTAADVLGPHAVPSESGRPARIVIRALLPGAHAARILPLPTPALPAPSVGDQITSHDVTSTGATQRHAEGHAGGVESASDAAVPMARLHAAGIFSAVTSWAAARPYLIEASYADGSVRRTADPYEFDPQLSDFDLYLLGEGTHYAAYDCLGAHPRSIAGVSGVLFAVWAPHARRVSVVGDWNAWDERTTPMRLRSGGVWELFIPGLMPGALYKYAVLSWHDDYRVLKADPYAFASELRPGTASRVADLSTYSWSDADWMHARGQKPPTESPICIYELHAGSWRPDPGTQASPRVSYRELAHQLVPYLRDLGYTHVELLPIMEHPLDASWGYQVTGYFAPTSRFGAPQDFMYFVDYCHQHGIGVLLDWVPAHFPKDEHGLRFFDGSHLYEYADPRLGEHPDWGTLVFDFGRNQVVNFLLASALFWLDSYHIDGLRVDAVASMLYRDYSREAGEWVANRYGGRENLEAVAFLRRFNELVHARFPGTLTIAEESTAWPQVSRPTYVGGLGFTFKWNMGWMHDVLNYLAHEPIHRRYHHNELTFSLMYAFSEHFILPFSHDEVVHLKASMLSKMRGDLWQRFANLRALYAYMYGHPGKKLLFMGGEFGQLSEWNEGGWLQWSLLDGVDVGIAERVEDGDEEVTGHSLPSLPGQSPHARLRQLIGDLNHLLLSSPALYESDSDSTGFEWIDCNDADSSVIVFVRFSADREQQMLVACNFTPIVRYGYRVGVLRAGYYAEVLNTDARVYGGGNVGNQGGVWSEPRESHGRAHSIVLTLPPLAVVMLRVGDAPPALPAPNSARDSARGVSPRIEHNTAPRKRGAGRQLRAPESTE